MGTVKVTANRLRKRKKFVRVARVVVLVILVLFCILYLVLGLIFGSGRFTITLDRSLALDSGIVMYESVNNRHKTYKLYAGEIGFMDNISGNWIRNDIDNEADGSHNGDNYIAYTFYLENEGSEVLNYWASISIDDVIRNVDEAVRVMVILNGERVVYAKKNSFTNTNEVGTELFYDDDTAVLRKRSGFGPGDVDKYTIVIWLEGDDPDCVDDLIGGEIKMHMDIREEHINQEK